MTHGINDPPGRLSLQRQRQAGEIARLNQRIAELEAALQALYDVNMDWEPEAAELTHHEIDTFELVRSVLG